MADDDGTAADAAAGDDPASAPDGEGEAEGEWPPLPAVPDEWVERRRSWRGISVRLAVHYLGNLGGEAADDPPAETEALVEGDDWVATLSSRKVGIGPTVSLTEVRVSFAGDPAELDDLVERFAQKAMRAGG
jgi:hypothetical protein